MNNSEEIKYFLCTEDKEIEIKFDDIESTLDNIHNYDDKKIILEKQKNRLSFELNNDYPHMISMIGFDVFRIRLENELLEFIKNKSDVK